MDVRDHLRQISVPFEVILHQPTPSATRLAHSLHVPGRRVAKGVLVRVEAGYVLAVLPATHRIDFPRLEAALRVETARLATEEEVASVFHDCELGALPPFGTLYGLRTIVDSSLSAFAEIIVEGNCRHEGLRLRYRDYESVEAPIRARFASLTGSGSQKVSDLRAG